MLGMGRVTSKYMGEGDGDGKAKPVPTSPHCHAQIPLQFI